MFTRLSLAVLVLLPSFAAAQATQPATRPAYTGWKQVFAAMPKGAKPRGAEWTPLERQMAAEWLEHELVGATLTVQESVESVSLAKTREGNPWKPTIIPKICVATSENAMAAQAKVSILCHAYFATEDQERLDRLRKGDNFKYSGTIKSVSVMDLTILSLYVDLDNCTTPSRSK